MEIYHAPGGSTYHVTCSEKRCFFIQRWDRLWPGTKEKIVKPLMKLQSETLLFLKFILISTGLLHVNGLWCQIKHNGSLSAGLINREESPKKGFMSHLHWLIDYSEVTFCSSDDECFSATNWNGTTRLYLERAQSLNNFYEVCNKKRERDLRDCNISLNLFFK